MALSYCLILMFFRFSTGAGCVESISFEGLAFKDVLIMRDQAMKLPRCDKQRFAEQIVYTLWSSIPDSDSD